MMRLALEILLAAGVVCLGIGLLGAQWLVRDLRKRVQRLEQQQRVISHRIDLAPLYALRDQLRVERDQRRVEREGIQQ